MHLVEPAWPRSPPRSQFTGRKKHQIITVSGLRVPLAHGWPEDLGGRYYPEQRGDYSTAFREVRARSPAAPALARCCASSPWGQKQTRCARRACARRARRQCGWTWMRRKPPSPPPSRLPTCLGGLRHRGATAGWKTFGGCNPPHRRARAQRVTQAHAAPYLTE